MLRTLIASFVLLAVSASRLEANDYTINTYNGMGNVSGVHVFVIHYVGDSFNGGRDGITDQDGTVALNVPNNGMNVTHYAVFVNYAPLAGAAYNPNLPSFVRVYTTDGYSSHYQEYNLDDF